MQSESDMRGLVGIPDVRTALGNMRMSVRIGAEGVNASMLRELAEWCDAHSAVSCTLRDRAPVAIEIAWFEEIVRRAWE